MMRLKSPKTLTSSNTIKNKLKNKTNKMEAKTRNEALLSNLIDTMPLYEVYPPTLPQIENDEQLEALAISLSEKYEELVDRFIIEMKKQIIDYIETSSPKTQKTQRDNQNEYVLKYFKKSLLRGNKPLHDLVTSAIWQFQVMTRDASNYYD